MFQALRVPLSSLLLSFVAPIAAQDAKGAAPAPVPADPLRAAAVRYGAAEWPRGERRVGVALGELELRGYTGGEVEQDGSFPLQRFFHDARGVARVLVEAYVETQVEGAHKALLGWLANVSRADAMPTAASAGIPVGDVGYVGWANQAAARIAWLAFVRGNVAVRVRCLDASVDPHPDLAAIAQAVDAAIGREAIAAPGPLPAPRLERFAAARSACRAGDDVPLAVIASDGGRVPALRFHVTGDGQGHVERDGNGAWRLRTTGPGRLVVHVVALGSRGVSATQSIPVDVAPR